MVHWFLLSLVRADSEARDPIRGERAGRLGGRGGVGHGCGRGSRAVLRSACSGSDGLSFGCHGCAREYGGGCCCAAVMARIVS